MLPIESIKTDDPKNLVLNHLSDLELEMSKIIVFFGSPDLEKINRSYLKYFAPRGVQFSKTFFLELTNFLKECLHLELWIDKSDLSETLESLNRQSAFIDYLETSIGHEFNYDEQNFFQITECSRFYNMCEFEDDRPTLSSSLQGVRGLQADDDSIILIYDQWMFRIERNFNDDTQLLKNTTHTLALRNGYLAVMPKFVAYNQIEQKWLPANPSYKNIMSYKNDLPCPCGSRKQYHQCCKHLYTENAPFGFWVLSLTKLLEETDFEKNHIISRLKSAPGKESEISMQGKIGLYNLLKTNKPISELIDYVGSIDIPVLNQIELEQYVEETYKEIEEILSISPTIWVIEAPFDTVVKYAEPKPKKMNLIRSYIEYRILADYYTRGIELLEIIFSSFPTSQILREIAYTKNFVVDPNIIDLRIFTSNFVVALNLFFQKEFSASSSVSFTQIEIFLRQLILAKKEKSIIEGKSVLTKELGTLSYLIDNAYPLSDDPATGNPIVNHFLKNSLAHGEGYGLNLRNEIAHKLTGKEPTQAESAIGIFLILKLLNSIRIDYSNLKF